MTIAQFRKVALAATTIALPLLASSFGAEARCVWYGPGSTGAAACAPKGYQGQAYAMPRPPVQPTQIGKVTYSPNAVRIPAGVMHRSCRRMPWGIDCR
jgi:hypothetical protein